jgi:hypothetical protein
VTSQQQQQVNGAAEELAEATRASSRVVADRAVSAQEHNAELGQSFFSNTIDNLHAQAEENRQMTRQLVE